MAKKSKRPYPLEKQTFWDKLIKRVCYGYKPDLFQDIALHGNINTIMLRKLTILINNEIKDCKSFKIGKTGDAEIRIDQKDYRSSYEKMYLVFKSESEKVISSLESRYIVKYKKIYPFKCDNIAEYSGGKMFSYSGFYYLYVVIR